jgi:hypothetical protein
MPLNSVQHYVRDVLDGLALEGPSNWSLTAVISDPVIADVAQGPILYIWAGRGTKKRHTMPRPIAWQRYEWVISASLIAVMNIDDPNLDSAFPLALQSIDGYLSTLPVPVIITDPDTGLKSQALNIGEELSMDYARMHTTGSEGEGLVQFGADITIDLKEDVSYLSGQTA